MSKIDEFIEKVKNTQDLRWKLAVFAVCFGGAIYFANHHFTKKEVISKPGEAQIKEIKRQMKEKETKQIRSEIPMGSMASAKAR